MLYRQSLTGYDPNWKPDEDVPAQTGQEKNAPAENALQENADEFFSSSDRKRPAEIAADTAQMQKTVDTWEMVGVEKSDFTAYWNRKEIAMIVEETQESKRAYYFDGGSLYYYNEKSNDGTMSLTVEFDDIGDVRGARMTVDGKQVRSDEDDYSAIVKHAVELKIAAEN